jgi:pantetheine-phosphate adenylyltransferase
MDFIENAMSVFEKNAINLWSLYDYVKHRKPNIGVYAGSFNPFTYGHLNVLEQAENMFDKVVIAFGKNPDKTQTSTTEFPKTISNREIVTYDGFISTLLQKYTDDGCNVTLIRGLRNEYDLNYEQNMVQYIKNQMPKLKVVFFLCDRKFEHVSSSSVRALEKVEKGSGKSYIVP